MKLFEIELKKITDTIETGINDIKSVVNLNNNTKFEYITYITQLFTKRWVYAVSKADGESEARASE